MSAIAGDFVISIKESYPHAALTGDDSMIEEGIIVTVLSVDYNLHSKTWLILDMNLNLYKWHGQDFNFDRCFVKLDEYDR